MQGANSIMRLFGQNSPSYCNCLTAVPICHGGALVQGTNSIMRLFAQNSPIYIYI